MAQTITKTLEGYVFAIDIGLTGAIAKLGVERTVYSQEHKQDTFEISLQGMFDMPLKNISTNKIETKMAIDLSALREMLDYKGEELDGVHREAVLEHIHTMPNDGRAGAFTFGRTYGIIEASVDVCGMKVYRVAPTKWKRDLDMINTNKNESRQAAFKLFPKHANLFKRIKDHNRADAVLIGLWYIYNILHPEVDSKGNFSYV